MKSTEFELQLRTSPSSYCSLREEFVEVRSYPTGDEEYQLHGTSSHESKRARHNSRLEEMKDFLRSSNGLKIA